MSKTLMISNDVYSALKNIKGDKSFSEIIRDLLSRKSGNGKNIAKYYGVLKDDGEYKKIKKDLNKKWKEWTQKYA